MEIKFMMIMLHNLPQSTNTVIVERRNVRRFAKCPLRNV